MMSDFSKYGQLAEYNGEFFRVVGYVPGHPIGRITLDRGGWGKSVPEDQVTPADTCKVDHHPDWPDPKWRIGQKMILHAYKDTAVWIERYYIGMLWTKDGWSCGFGWLYDVRDLASWQLCHVEEYGMMEPYDGDAWGLGNHFDGFEREFAGGD